MGTPACVPPRTPTQKTNCCFKPRRRPPLQGQPMPYWTATGTPAAAFLTQQQKEQTHVLSRRATTWPPGPWPPQLLQPTTLPSDSVRTAPFPTPLPLLSQHPPAPDILPKTRKTRQGAAQQHPAPPPPPGFPSKHYSTHDKPAPAPPNACGGVHFGAASTPSHPRGPPHPRFPGQHCWLTTPRRVPRKWLPPCPFPARPQPPSSDPLRAFSANANYLRQP